jgi:hypothetical protein
MGFALYCYRRALLFIYVTNHPPPPTAAVAMADIQTVLCLAAKEILSDQSYKQPPTFYLLWSEIGRTYFENPFNQVFDAIWNKRSTKATKRLIHPTALSILRFASDAEPDQIPAPQNSGLQHRLYAKTLQEFFNSNLTAVWHMTDEWREENIKCYGLDYVQRTRDSNKHYFYGDTNFIAHWANFGYVEEAAIRNHILQSLISHPKLHGHQADALIILFKLAGATFEAYVDPAVVDRCFELLTDNYTPASMDRELFQVCMPRVVKGDRKAKTISRRCLRYGSVAGRDSLHRPCSPQVSRSPLARTGETPLQLPLPHPWDFREETPNLRFPSPPHPNPLPHQNQTPFLDLP